jgi:hypothetical protein
MGINYQMSKHGRCNVCAIVVVNVLVKPNGNASLVNKPLAPVIPVDIATVRGASIMKLKNG